jgi:hypothetical protein
MRTEEAPICRPAPTGAQPFPPKSRLAAKAAWSAAVALAALLSGCTNGSAVPAPVPQAPPDAAATTGSRSLAAAASTPAPSLVRVPRPDYARPSSVAASFFTAWASVDAIHDRPGAYLARCAGLVTPALERQLEAGQPAPVGWQVMRAEHMVSLAQVRAVTRPSGAPAPSATVTYLRVYAQQVTTSAMGRTVTSDGITLELIRHGRRWLVSRLLWY